MAAGGLQLDRLGPKSRADRAGFTLVEVVVVVGIIGLLLAIIIPVANAVLESNRKKATLATMQILQAGIDDFSSKPPLARDGQSLCEQETTNSNQGRCSSYRDVFGNLPPSPLAKFTCQNPSPDPECARTLDTDPTTSLKFDTLIRRYCTGLRLRARPQSPRSYQPEGAAARTTGAPAPDYASIESLLLFLRRYSEQGEAIMSKLSGQLTNLDRDLVDVLDSGGQSDATKALELPEVNDVWKRPLRYDVIAKGIGEFKYELRSAGPDGKFEDPFSEESVGDDVVLTGP